MIQYATKKIVFDIGQAYKWTGPHVTRTQFKIKKDATNIYSVSSYSIIQSSFRHDSKGGNFFKKRKRDVDTSQMDYPNCTYSMVQHVTVNHKSPKINI